MERDLYTKDREVLKKRFEEVNFKYRRVENLYELHDNITQISYWFKKYKNKGFILVRVTDYN